MMSRHSVFVVRAALLRVALLMCIAATSGCSSSTSPTIGTISAEGLAGVWRLELLQPAGLGAVLTPSGATYTLTLSEGIASARADCNVCSGRFTLLGDSLNIATGLACTRAACPTASFESLYTQILSGESRVGISGSTMALVSARGLLRFTR
jgi:heat shock protein HslJ